MTKNFKTTPTGTFYFYDSEQTIYHREDGPAIEYFPNCKEGYKAWYLNGILHREGGPAIEWNNGSGEWFLNNKRHREDGPAIEGKGCIEYYLNGKRYDVDSTEEWLKFVKSTILQ